VPTQSAATAASSAASTAERAATGFVLELAQALHRHGTPAHRLEEVLSTVAARLGLQAAFFSTPTSIMIGFGDPLEQHTHLLRVDPGQPDLGGLARLGEITAAVLDGQISAAEALQRVRALAQEPARWPRWLTPVAFVLSSAAVACFLRLPAADVLVASLLGLVTAAIVMGTARAPAFAHVVEPLAAFVVSTLALATDALMGSGAGYLTSLAGLVILLPGLTFTVALTELSTRHLASGTARLSGALVVFLGLGFGLALGAKLGTAIGTALRDLLPAGALATSRVPVPAWTEWLALLIAPLGFTVLLNGDRRDAIRIVLACATAYLVSRFAGASMGEELGAFLGAFAVSAGSNLVARRWRRSAMVTQVPGLLILVPGSIGFRSVTSLLGQQVEVGIAAAFRVGIIGISLAAGIVAGNLVAGAGRRREAGSR
jgi:uncharacterized membrane protein YjjP (DUF1212 family)